MLANNLDGVLPTNRYSIAETCKILQCHRNSLLKWTNEGRIKCEYHRATMRKYYTGTQIEKFWRNTL
jgi:predicted site-specific integrase-resolvase